MTTKPVVYIVLYSLYQHVYKLSQSIQQGLEEKGVQVKVFQVAETLSDEILSKMQAPTKPDLPIMTVDKLAEPDGIIFGLPTRFGLFPAQIKTLLDATGALWAKGALAGKFAGTFFSTASQHGGQETTALTAVTYFAHHGMMYVPFGYANVALQNNDEVIGGSAYGSGTISDGDGSRQPTQTELDIAKNQGQNFGVIVSTFVKGRGAIEGATSDINNKLADGNANDPTASADPTTATTTATNATETGAAAGVGAAGAATAIGAATAAGAATTTSGADTATAAGGAGAAGASSSGVGNAAPTNATGGVPKETAGNASTAPADTNTLDANNGPATPVHGTTNEGNAAPTNAIAGTPSAPAGNAAAAATTINDAPAATPGGKTTTNASTEPTATTAGNATDTTATNNASKVGASAGATAAGAASTVPNKLKDNKPKKKKWFCC